MLLVAPLVYLLFVAMSLALPTALGSLVLVGLLLGLLVPPLALLADSRPWLLPPTALLVSAAAFVAGFVMAR